MIDQIHKSSEKLSLLLFYILLVVICAREKKCSLKIIKKFPFLFEYLEANRKVAGHARHTLNVTIASDRFVSLQCLL